MSVTGGDLKKIKETTNEFISNLNVKLEAEVSGDINGIKINLNGKDSALLIGYHGETLGDFAYLLGLIIKKHVDKEERIRIDINGYMENKDKKIKEMTLRVVEKVKRSGFPESLTGLNAYERRVAHTVAANEGLVSESEGYGKDRVLVIKPRKVNYED